jgi:ion channel-forming bestrophin family protein
MSRRQNPPEPMIIRPRPSAFQLLVIMRGSIVPRIAPQIIGFALYAALVVALARHFGLESAGYGLAPFTVLGVALSIFLGFRNNAAYERWWEARKLWGQLVFEIRNFAREVRGLIPEDCGEVRPLLMESLAFCHYLRGALRKVDADPEARRFIAEAADVFAQAVNKPDAVLRSMGRRLAALKKTGRIDAIDFRVMDEKVCGMAALQAGCERISSTPLPFTYSLLLHRFAYWFCLLLPFGLVSVAGWASPLFTALVVYSFFGLDALSEELEDPFGTGNNDLALDSLCRVDEISVFEALGEPPPAALEADNFHYS